MDYSYISAITLPDVTTQVQKENRPYSLSTPVNLANDHSISSLANRLNVFIADIIGRMLVGRLHVVLLFAVQCCLFVGKSGVL